jgi:hypothetical protein
VPNENIENRKSAAPSPFDDVGGYLLKKIADETLKKIIGVLIVGAASLVVYSLGLELPSRGSQSWLAYAWVLFSLNWWRVALLLAVLGALVGGGVFFWNLVKRYRKLRLEAAVKEHAGLINFYPVSSYAEGMAPRVNAEIQQSAQTQIVSVVELGSQIDMILVSGYRTIGPTSQEGYLVPILKSQRNKRYNILLLDPACPPSIVALRAQGIGKSSNEYQEGIREVLGHLALLQHSVYVNVHVWLYREMPMFQMFKTPHEIWIQSAVAARTEDSPVAGFKESEYSLFWSLRRYWDRMWETFGGDAKEADLTNYFPKPGPSSRRQP